MTCKALYKEWAIIQRETGKYYRVFKLLKDNNLFKNPKFSSGILDFEVGSWGTEIGKLPQY